ncbi:MAG: TonB family protein [Acidobacteriales bacterium]|nr:TonB family protein [Terriglobales bacterium]
MNTPVQTEQAETTAPRLLFQYEKPRDRSSILRAGVGSIGLHVLVLAGLTLLPAGSALHHLPARELAQRITPLIAPPSELTQTAKNRGPISKELDLPGLLPRPCITLPPGIVSTTRPAASVPGLIAPPSLPEPPRMETGAQLPQGPPLGSPNMPMPQIQPVEKPKLAFEKPGATTGVRQAPSGSLARTPALAVPNQSVQEAGRATARGRGAGGLTIGDIGEGMGGLGDGLNLPPSPGRNASSLELLSDPMGIDLRPYLVRVLSAVRHNWMAVIPESVRYGRRGRVVIQFAIAKDGGVPKLVIVMPSGTDALDRAAVAGISASNPFPPLPAEYRGNQLRLQLNFSYNLRGQ